MFFYYAKKTRALSLILTLLIISSILTGTVLVGDIMIRHSQVVKGAEISEKAYFAAESAMEKVSYEILKNYENIGLSSEYDFSGELDNEAEYSVVYTNDDISPDDQCPNPDGIECSSGSITGDNVWKITLEPNQSFQLDLDINGAVYPATLTISKDGIQPSDLLIYQCTTMPGPPRVCSSDSSQVFKADFPNDISLAVSSYYYKIRINNLGSLSESYTLAPSDSTLPIGINVRATGVYSGYERIVTSNFPKWQKFGVD